MYTVLSESVQMYTTAVVHIICTCFRFFNMALLWRISDFSLLWKNKNGSLDRRFNCMMPLAHTTTASMWPPLFHRDYRLCIVSRSKDMVLGLKKIDNDLEKFSFFFSFFPMDQSERPTRQHIWYIYTTFTDRECNTRINMYPYRIIKRVLCSQPEWHTRDGCA